MLHERAGRKKSIIRVAAIAAAGALTVGLAGCVPEAAPHPHPTPPDLNIDQVDVPDSMLYADDITSLGGSIVAASGTLPYLLGGALVEPGRRGIPTVWVSDDGSDWKAITVDDDFDGSFAGGVNGTAELTAIGGSIWNEGVTTAALWVSEDRSDWSRVELPEEFALKYRISDFVVLDDRVLVVAADVAGDAAGRRI
jgi:hypothetical protein